MSAEPFVLDEEDRAMVRARLAWEVGTLGPQVALLAVGPGMAGGAEHRCADLAAAVGLLSNIGASQAGDIGGPIPVDPLFNPVLRALAQAGIESHADIGDDERGLWARIWQQMQDDET